MEVLIVHYDSFYCRVMSDLYILIVERCPCGSFKMSVMGVLNLGRCPLKSFCCRVISVLGVLNAKKFPLWVYVCHGSFDYRAMSVKRVMTVESPLYVF